MIEFWSRHNWSLGFYSDKFAHSKDFHFKSGTYAGSSLDAKQRILHVNLGGKCFKIDSTT